MFATGFTGGSLNPARSLGPDVIAGLFDGTAWIYYTAPFTGALLATAVYKLLKVFRYETAVEGQDGDDVQLILRDKGGNVTGMVEQVNKEDAPEIRRAESLPPSPNGSMLNLPLSAGSGAGMGRGGAGGAFGPGDATDLALPSDQPYRDEQEVNEKTPAGVTSATAHETL